MVAPILSLKHKLQILYCFNEEGREKENDSFTQMATESEFRIRMVAVRYIVHQRKKFLFSLFQL
jgi:hypothetical protein